MPPVTSHNDTHAKQIRLPDPAERPVLRVWPDVGRALDLSRAATYAAAKRGDIPVIRLGKRLVVPTAQLRRMLGVDQ